MLNRDYRDIAAGGFLLVVGVSAALYASSNYSLGTITRMGAGMMPTALGWVLAVFGLAILVGALFRPGVMPEIRLATPALVLGSVAAFALVITPFGLMPAVIAVTVVSSLAELEIKPVRVVSLSVALCAMAYAIFVMALGLPIPLFAWPF